jgi:hypothetical protein
VLFRSEGAEKQDHIHRLQDREGAEQQAHIHRLQDREGAEQQAHIHKLQAREGAEQQAHIHRLQDREGPEKVQSSGLISTGYRTGKVHCDENLGCHLYSFSYFIGLCGFVVNVNQ